MGAAIVGTMMTSVGMGSSSSVRRVMVDTATRFTDDDVPPKADREIVSSFSDVKASCLASSPVMKKRCDPCLTEEMAVFNSVDLQ